MELKTEPARLVGVLFLGMFLSIGLMQMRSEQITPDMYDAGQYVRGAYNLFYYDVFSEVVQKDVVPTPQVGREPLYSLVLSSIFYFEPAADQVTADCLHNRGSCPPRGYLLGKWLNILLFAFAGSFLTVLGWLVTGNVLAGAVAGGAIWINLSAQNNMLYMVSDPLALALASALALVFYLAMSRGHLWSWALAGFVLSALIFTKSIFLYFIPISLIFLLIWFIQNRMIFSCRFRFSVCVLFVSCLMVPLHVWMERNNKISDHYTMTVERSGIALNQRTHLNNMTWPEFGASFVFWIRDCGDSLAESLLPVKYWDKLRLDHPEGYYLQSQLGYFSDVEEVFKTQDVTIHQARSIVDDKIISSILERPFKHFVVNFALFWRGLWVDQFILISLPGLFFLIAWSIRNKSWPIAGALAPSIFNLLMYPTVSFNIPRYQLTALPALALATMFILVWFIFLFKGREGRQSHRLFG